MKDERFWAVVVVVILSCILFFTIGLVTEKAVVVDSCTNQQSFLAQDKVFTCQYKGERK